MYRKRCYALSSRTYDLYIKSSPVSYAHLFSTERVEEDEEALWNTVKTVLDGALSDFIAMREREGERIQKDLCERIDYMRTLVKEVDERSPQTVKEYSDKLYEKIKDVLDGKEIDEARILTEVAIYADKVAVNEETVRLGSHFEEFDTIITVSYTHLDVYKRQHLFSQVLPPHT